MNTCPRCYKPHPALNGMTPWNYYHSCANLGKYETDCGASCSFTCACEWLDRQIERVEVAPR